MSFRVFLPSGAPGLAADVTACEEMLQTNPRENIGSGPHRWGFAPTLDLTALEDLKKTAKGVISK